MNTVPKGNNAEAGKPDQVALGELLEVEACLRDMLQSTNEPSVLQRLFSLHREIQRYVAEVNGKKS